jgi:putative ABC transport system permease protein
MKYLPLIWATLWRKKTRTIFTLLSIIVAFLLFGVLETVDYAFAHPGGITGANKLITVNKYSIVLSLPFVDGQQIRSVPGVAEVTWITWFGGYYQESKNFVFALPIDTDTYFNLHKDEFVVADEQMTAFRHTRTGAVVNSALMKKFGWKIGDKVPLHSTIWTQKSDGSLDWTFDIVGVFDVKDPTQASTQATTLLFHYEEFDEGRSFGKGNVGWFEERVDDPAKAPAIAAQIDALFANSSNETKTQPANDFAMTFVKQYGDIGFVLRAILGAVFFALLFLTGNTMMQSVRERVPELAVLKTIGFGDGTVLGLVIGEALALCVIAAVIGLGLSFLALPIIHQALQGVEVSPKALVPGIAAAVLLAFIVGLPPALRAMRLNIVDALADKR